MPSTSQKLVYKHQHRYSKDLHFIVKTTPVFLRQQALKRLSGPDERIIKNIEAVYTKNKVFKNLNKSII